MSKLLTLSSVIAKSLFALTFVLSSLVSTATFAAATSENDIKPFVAKYDLFRQGEKYGEGSRVLKDNGQNSYSLELSSKIEWLIFSDERTEYSEFVYKDSEITPVNYLFSRTGTGRDKNLSINFEDNKSLVISPKSKKGNRPTEWQEGWLDEMTLHLQLQQDLIKGKKDFEFNMVSKSGNHKTYQMEVIGEELISTGLGRFNAIKVSRIYKDNKFTAQYAWFIPELNYTLARLWRIKKGVEQYDLVIKAYNPAS